METTTYHIILCGAIAIFTIAALYLLQHRRKPSPVKSFTFRVQAIPGDWDKTKLREPLAADLEASVEAISVRSIHKDSGGSEGVALVNFQQTSTKLSNLPEGSCLLRPGTRCL